jgi:hypothetical protein
MIGKYTNMTSVKAGQMSTEDLSMEGIDFCDTGIVYFKVSDMLVFVFQLDDFEKSRNKPKVAVRQKRGEGVGCEILEIMEGGADFGLCPLPGKGDPPQLPHDLKTQTADNRPCLSCHSISFFEQLFQISHKLLSSIAQDHDGFRLPKKRYAYCFMDLTRHFSGHPG